MSPLGKLLQTLTPTEGGLRGTLWALETTYQYSSTGSCGSTSYKYSSSRTAAVLREVELGGGEMKVEGYSPRGAAVCALATNTPNNLL